MPTDAISHFTGLWRKSGINEGDMVLVHSNIRRTLLAAKEMKYDVSPTMVLESFLQAVGQSGTLLLPLFNFDYTKGVTFDIRTSPSQMGALTEAGRKHPSAIRTGHPIYSFAVLGARRNEFIGLDNFSGYGADSPFGILHRNHGKIAVLDLSDQNSVTFYHYIEESLCVPYRYHKTFTGTYIDRSGETSERTYGLFVRDIEKGVETHVNPMGELLWQQGLYSGSRPNEGSGLRIINAKDMFDATAEVICDNRACGVLYKIKN